jgi:hypothetical protein
MKHGQLLPNSTRPAAWSRAFIPKHVFGVPTPPTTTRTAPRWRPRDLDYPFVGTPPMLEPTPAHAEIGRSLTASR